MAADPSAPPEPARWIKLRASAAERARWQALAAEAEAHFIRWRRARRPAEGM